MLISTTEDPITSPATEVISSPVKSADASAVIVNEPRLDVNEIPVRSTVKPEMPQVSVTPGI